MEDKALPWYFHQLRRGDPVFFDRPEELPQEADRERQFCAAEGIKSHIGIPLIAASNVLGVLNFSSFGHAGFWQKDILARIQLIGEVFANAILHKRDQEAINMALAESERLRKQLERENIYLREQITLKHEHGAWSVKAGREQGTCRGRASRRDGDSRSVAWRNRNRKGIVCAGDSQAKHTEEEVDGCRKLCLAAIHAD